MPFDILMIFNYHAHFTDEKYKELNVDSLVLEYQLDITGRGLEIRARKVCYTM